MDLDDLLIFRTVVREGGVTRAASQLCRVPSNVTTRIKQLESRLGIRLFRRQGRDLVLTDPGRKLLHHAERLLHMADMAERDMRSDTLAGILKLGSLESAAGARLPPIFSKLHERYPDIRLELKTGTTSVMLDLLGRYEIEAAFVSEPFERGKFDARPIFDEELVLITARNASPPTCAADLEAATLVAFPHGCSYRRRLTDWLSAAGAAPTRILELGSYHAIIACVAAGSGVAIVPAQILDSAAMGSAVERHRLPDHLGRNRTHLVWRGEPSAPLQALMSLLPMAATEQTEVADVEIINSAAPPAWNE